MMAFKKNNILRNSICAIISFLVIVQLVYYIFSLIYLFKGYDYVYYNGQKYVEIESLCFDDEIIRDESGNYSGYKNGSKVSVKIDGWFIKEMILLDNTEAEYLFNYNRECWLIKESSLDTDLFSTDKIEKVVVYYSGENFELSEEEKTEFLIYVEQLKNSDDIIIDEYTYENKLGLSYDSDSDLWGGICVKGYGMPDNAYYDMFSFYKKGEKIFLKSHSDDFGFEFGQYICIQSSNK